MTSPHQQGTYCQDKFIVQTENSLSEPLYKSLTANNIVFSHFYCNAAQTRDSDVDYVSY